MDNTELIKRMEDEEDRLSTLKPEGEQISGASADFTEGVCEDGAAILRDGKPVSISEILRLLNNTADLSRRLQLAADEIGQHIDRQYRDMANFNALRQNCADIAYRLVAFNVNKEFGEEVRKAVLGFNPSSEQISGEVRRERERRLWNDEIAARNLEETPACEDCPPVGYPTDKTRCTPCPRRAKDAVDNMIDFILSDETPLGPEDQEGE